jgi:hypothetical protein
VNACFKDGSEDGDLKVLKSEMDRLTICVSKRELGKTNRRVSTS